MKILVTGSSGFIGFHLIKKLVIENNKVVGVDNLNNYYDVKIKRDRNKILNKSKNYIFYKVDLNNKSKLSKIFKKHNFDLVINLAAQAGVRYSISHPQKYFDSNMVGFFNLLEISRKNNVKNFFSASTSSVYGNKKGKILKENFTVDEPEQFYAATKISNELIGKVYSKIYKMNFVLFRFFTVYGPWGRPDMSLYKFVTNIKNNNKVQIFNYGNHNRDFTFVDDIVQGISKAVYKYSKRSNKEKFEVFNFGSGKKTSLLKYLKIIETHLKKKAKISHKKLQQGDVISTLANISKARKKLNYKPKVNIYDGIKRYINWYEVYYKR